jgi:hypothetical protein
MGSDALHELNAGKLISVYESGEIQRLNAAQ